MHKSGSKNEPNSYVSQIEVFRFKMFLMLPLENFFCRKHSIHLEGAGRDSYDTEGNVAGVLCM
jgi:hypothetical protein